MLQTYLQILNKRPLLTKSITSGILFACGDIIAQSFLIPSPNDNKLSQSLDWYGLVSFSSFGLILYAPSNHYWFAWMEKTVAVGKYYQTRPMVQALARVTLHSIAYAPFSIISLFLWMGIAQGNSSSALKESISPQKVFPIWWAGAVFWIPTMLSIYRFVPLNLRVLATSTANVFWTTYLSFKNSVIVKSASASSITSEMGTSSTTKRGKRSCSN